jgi:rhamnulokinase
MSRFLAFDLGAESGRAILGEISDAGLSLEELHRFPNIPVRLPTGLYWDTLRLWQEIQQGLAVAGRERRLELAGIGVDTWGVDFGLLGADGALVDNPRHYRDARNNGILERTFAVVPRQEIFASTGIQFMQLNSLFQWHAMRLAGAPALDAAHTLLFMPDLFNYFLTGVKTAEQTIASTSQFYNPVEKRWTNGLLVRLGLDPAILPEIIPAGAKLGPLLPHVAAGAGLASETRVYATAGHDTAAAVAAVPAESGAWCYISSGTWSLMGVETGEPVINAQSLQLNFTNEVGVEGKIRLLKNIAGLWLIQECRRAWAAAGENYGYEQLARMAAEAPAFGAILDPDAFLEPGGMPEKIADCCRRTGQPPPATPGARKPRPALPPGAGEPGGAARAAARCHPHCRRRVASRAAEPIRRRRDRPPRARRARGGDGGRQRSHAGDRRGDARRTCGSPRARAPVISSGRVRAAPGGRLARGLRPLRRLIRGCKIVARISSKS